MWVKMPGRRSDVPSLDVSRLMLVSCPHFAPSFVSSLCSGDFIYEYCGEVYDYAEFERRQQVRRLECFLCRLLRGYPKNLSPLTVCA